MLTLIIEAALIVMFLGLVTKLIVDLRQSKYQIKLLVTSSKTDDAYNTGQQERLDFKQK